MIAIDGQHICPLKMKASSEKIQTVEHYLHRLTQLSC